MKGNEKLSSELRIVATHDGVPLPVPTKYLPIKIRVAAGRDLSGVNKQGVSNPYCVLDVEGVRLKKSRTKTVKEVCFPIPFTFRSYLIYHFIYKLVCQPRMG